MRYILLAATIFATLLIHGQNEPIEIVSTGYGRTMDQAITASVRSALEQTFGVFISSDTRIQMEDHSNQEGTMGIIDEIAVLTNGNIVDYEILSSTNLESGEAAVTTRCTIALEPMRSFVASKGHEASFAGGMFARTIKLRQLNITAEERAVQDLVDQSRLILSEAVNFKVSPKDPIQSEGFWKLPIQVEAAWNQNFELWLNHIGSSLTNIAMTENEVQDFRRNGQPTFSFALALNGTELNPIYELLHFRNVLSISHVMDMMHVLGRALLNFKIDAGVLQIDGLEMWKRINNFSMYAPGFLGIQLTDSKYCWLDEGYTQQHGHVKLHSLRILNHSRQSVSMDEYTLMDQSFWTGNGYCTYGKKETGNSTDCNLSVEAFSLQVVENFYAGISVTEDNKVRSDLKRKCLNIGDAWGRGADDLFLWNLNDLKRSINPSESDPQQLRLEVPLDLDLTALEQIQSITVTRSNLMKLR